MARLSSDTEPGADALAEQHNALRADVFSRITYGLDADKGAPGDANRLYHATDADITYYDNGDAWVQLSWWQFKAGDILRKSADTERNTANTAPTKQKEIKTYLPGILRVKFDLKVTAAGTAYGRIYKNGVAYGTQRSDASGSYQTFTEDLIFAAEDLIQLYIWHSTGGGFAFCQNFRIYIAGTDDMTVGLD